MRIGQLVHYTRLQTASCGHGHDALPRIVSDVVASPAVAGLRGCVAVAMGLSLTPLAMASEPGAAPVTSRPIPQNGAMRPEIKSDWPASDPARQGFPAEALTVPTQINVEVDYMYTADHIHRFYQDEIDMVVALFACQGITLTIEISDSIPEVPVLYPGTSLLFDNTSPGQWVDLKNTYFDHLGQPGWHYCIMAHTYNIGLGTGNGGYAEIVGDDFTVTLGDWSAQVGTPFQRASIFTHELGHNLSLRHAGSQNDLVVSYYKPNFASVMSYRYSSASMRMMMRWCSAPLTDTCRALPFKHLDYSHGTLPTLDESALVEADGMGFGAVDWNCNGFIDIAPVAHDLSATWWCPAAEPLHVLTDYDDWSHLVDVTFAASAEALESRPTAECVPLDQVKIDQALMRMSGCSSNPWNVPVMVEPCVYVEDDADNDGILATCDDCPSNYDPLQEDTDLDGTGEACDNCPGLANAGQNDTDIDGAGDPCDNCPANANALQENFDSDPLGDVCDPCPRYSTPGNAPFVTGDANADGVRNSADIIHLVNYTFKGGLPPLPVAGSGDVNCDHVNTSSDVIFLVNYVFKSGTAPCNACLL